MGSGCGLFKLNGTFTQQKFPGGGALTQSELKRFDIEKARNTYLLTSHDFGTDIAVYRFDDVRLLVPTFPPRSPWSNLFWHYHHDSYNGNWLKATARCDNYIQLFSLKESVDSDAEQDVQRLSSMSRASFWSMQSLEVHPCIDWRWAVGRTLTGYLPCGSVCFRKCSKKHFSLCHITCAGTAVSVDFFLVFIDALFDEYPGQWCAIYGWSPSRICSNSVDCHLSCRVSRDP